MLPLRQRHEDGKRSDAMRDDLHRSSSGIEDLLDRVGEVRCCQIVERKLFAGRLEAIAGAVIEQPDVVAVVSKELGDIDPGCSGAEPVGRHAEAGNQNDRRSVLRAGRTAAVKPRQHVALWRGVRVKNHLAGVVRRPAFHVAIERIDRLGAAKAPDARLDQRIDEPPLKLERQQTAPQEPRFVDHLHARGEPDHVGNTATGEPDADDDPVQRRLVAEEPLPIARACSPIDQVQAGVEFNPGSIGVRRLIDHERQPRRGLPRAPLARVEVDLLVSAQPERAPTGSRGVQLSCWGELQLVDQQLGVDAPLIVDHHVENTVRNDELPTALFEIRRARDPDHLYRVRAAVVVPAYRGPRPTCAETTRRACPGRRAASSPFSRSA